MQLQRPRYKYQGLRNGSRPLRWTWLHTLSIVFLGAIFSSGVLLAARSRGYDIALSTVGRHTSAATLLSRQWGATAPSWIAASDAAVAVARALRLSKLNISATLRVVLQRSSLAPRSLVAIRFEANVLPDTTIDALYHRLLDAIITASTTPGELPTLPHKHIVLLGVYGNALDLDSRVGVQPRFISRRGGSGVATDGEAGAVVHLGYTSHLVPRIELPAVVRGAHLPMVVIGVLTTPEQLATRALAIAKTWGKLKTTNNVRVLFFVGNSSTTARLQSRALNPGAIAVVRLGNVSDTYPPQAKSFAMLAFLARHYGAGPYSWFMRADDDSYINLGQLTRFVDQFDETKLWYLGRPGTGRVEEWDELGIAKHSATGARMKYCLGGPGVVFSRAALGQLYAGGHLAQCAAGRNLASGHEDTEVGRCVHRWLDRECAFGPRVLKSMSGMTSYTLLRHLFLVPFPRKEPEVEPNGQLKMDAVEVRFSRAPTSYVLGAVSIHPIRSMRAMVILHAQAKGALRPMQLETNPFGIAGETARSCVSSPRAQLVYSSCKSRAATGGVAWRWVGLRYALPLEPDGCSIPLPRCALIAPPREANERPTRVEIIQSGARHSRQALFRAVKLSRMRYSVTVGRSRRAVAAKLFANAVSEQRARLVVLNDDTRVADVRDGEFGRRLDELLRSPRCGVHAHPALARGGVIVLGGDEARMLAPEAEMQDAPQQDPDASVNVALLSETSHVVDPGEAGSACTEAHPLYARVHGAIFHKSTFRAVLDFLVDPRFTGLPLEAVFRYLSWEGYPVVRARSDLIVASR